MTTLDKGGTVLANIHHHVISHISDPIYGVTGYYSDNDSTQHVVVATTNGSLYEIHWNRNSAPTPPQWLAQFPGLASLGGFYTSDDNLQHVIVAIEDGQLYELYFSTPQQGPASRSLVHLHTTLGPSIGMAAFYTSEDRLRHATVGSKEVNTDYILLHEIVWNAQVNPSTRNLGQFRLVAAIAGFFDLTVHTRDVIVAMQGGDVFDVYYGGGILAGEEITTKQVTTFPSALKNVATFVSSDTGYRHVIVLDDSGRLYDYSYTPEQVFGQTELFSLGNVIDMAAYYSAYDKMRHVILATDDGNIHEVYYGQLG
jgi:hypothetical protein